MGVAGANMQWGRFVCPSCSQKRESTAFELILRSAWGLSSPGKQVGRSSTPCRCAHIIAHLSQKRITNEFYDPAQAVPQLNQYSVTQARNIGFEATHTLVCSDNTHWCISSEASLLLAV